MPKRDQRPPTSQKQQPEEVVVRLKPVLGITPGIYLTILCGLAVLLALFLLLVLPGLRHRGSYLSVEGTPSRSTVQVDGRYAGTTPCRIFMARGVHKVEILRPFFTSSTFETDTPGRIFATLIVPQRRSAGYSLELQDEAGYYRHALLDLVHNPDVSSIAPETVQDALSAGGSARAASTFLNDVMYFVTNSLQLEALLKAAAMLVSVGEGQAISALPFDVNNIAQLSAIYDNAPAWYLLALDKDKQSRLLQEPWAQGYAQKLASMVEGFLDAPIDAGAGPRVGESLLVGGVAFRSVPAGTLLMGKDDSADAGTSLSQLLPHPVQIARFLIASTEVTNRQFRAFVEAVPRWKASNRAELVAQGLASEGYLESWTGDAPPAGTEELPVTGVSWHAAVAYCSWLSTRAAALSPRAVVRLPSEAEWEWAARGGVRGSAYPSGDRPGLSRFYAKDVTGPARVGTSGTNGYGLSDMAGNVWEWCADPWSPATYLLSSFDPVANARLADRVPVSDERVVRGGAWSTQRELAKVYTRGVQPADWCTPHLGFRPVLALP